MQSHRPILNQHRLRRLALWTLAVLSWIAAMLFHDRAVTFRHIQQRTGFISLPWLTDLVGKLLIARAAQLARLRRRRRLIYWRHGRDLHRPHIIRSVLGARLRRALKHRDIGAWIENLIRVLRNLDAYAMPLARRLRRGLTRLWPIVPPIASATLLLGPPAPSPAVADTS